MGTPSEPQGLDAALASTTSDELVKRIRKLRWMGMEEEAERLQSELDKHGRAVHSVLAAPRDTD